MDFDQILQMLCLLARFIVFNAISVGPGMRLHFAASDLGRHCVAKSLLSYSVYY